MTSFKRFQFLPLKEGELSTRGVLVNEYLSSNETWCIEKSCRGNGREAVSQVHDMIIKSQWFAFVVCESIS
jgi:hypothetical protein